MRLKRHAQRFQVQPFTNRAGSKSWRVTGRMRNGTRIRQNFTDPEEARKKQTQLEGEYWAGHQDVALRTTRLTDEQLKVCETALAMLDGDHMAIVTAVSHWLHHGKHLQPNGDSPKLDDAVKQFGVWLKDTPSMRPPTKRNLKFRLQMFTNGMPNLPVAHITADHIDNYLGNREASPASKDNDRRAASRFFSWCMDRPRRWCVVNPCAAVKVEKGDKAPPVILDIGTCQKIMRQGMRFKKGKLAPYFAVCLFGGLRPDETKRLTWAQVNLDDHEIRLEAHQTKTKRPRTITIDEPLLDWLRAYKKKPFHPPNFRKDFRTLLLKVGFGTPTDDTPELKPWPEDVLRHTAISHYFRKHESYGKAAERFGNSEQVIKNHYQGRVTSAETAKFYAITPDSLKPKKRKTKKGGRK